MANYNAPWNKGKTKAACPTLRGGRSKGCRPWNAGTGTRRLNVCQNCGTVFTGKIPERFYRYCGTPCRNAGQLGRPVHSIAFKQAASQLMKANKVWMQARMNRPSRPQLAMFELAKAIWPDAELERPEGRRFIDVAIPSRMLALEFDGAYWHREKDETKRDAELNAAGWAVYHFSDIKEAERAIRGL